MSDVLADLETRINQARTDLAPLVAAEAAAVADAANKAKARIAQDVQIAALVAAHAAARARLLGSEAVGAVEREAGKVAATVETDAGKAWKWLISHSWVGAIGAAAGYGVKLLGWL